MLQTILLLLSIAGALPEAIEGVRALWDWIDSIRDDKVRKTLESEACSAICAQICPVAKAVVSQANCLKTIEAMTAKAKAAANTIQEPEVR